jgi:competence protein ComEC
MPVAALALIAGAALVPQWAALPSAAALAGLAAAAASVWLMRFRVVAAFMAGVILAAAQGHGLLAGDWPCSRDGEQLELAGVVTAPAEARPGRIDFDFDVDAGGRESGVPPRVRMSWYEPAAVPRPGETWQFSARLRCRSGFANPGAFERELDLLRRGYGATGHVAGPVRPRRLDSSPWRTPFSAARAWAGERIAAAAGDTRSAGVLQGLAVGLRGGIDPAIQEALVATGTAHLVAISGLHVTAFAVVVLLLSRVAYGRLAGPSSSSSWPLRQATLMLAVTVAYGLLAGASLPTVRTVLMVALALALRAGRRHATVADVLGASALLLAAVDPLAVTSAGFWLSFVAVAALLGLIEGRDGALRSFARAQAAVSVVLAPVLVAAFGGLPLAGPLVNALAIPVFSFLLLPATLAATALLPLAPGLAALLWSGLGAALDRCWPVLEWAGGLPWAVIRPPAAPGWLVAAGVAVAVAAVVVPGAGCRRLAAVLVAALLFRTADAPVRGAFDLTLLDVGHGLAAVVRTKTRTLVFDTGPRWRGGGNAARVTLTPFLRRLGVQSLDLVVVSHADGDHAGGLGELRRAFAVTRVIGDAGEAGGTDAPCVAGDTWRWDGVQFEVLHPPDGGSFDRNDASCALRVSGPGGALLLLADPEAPAERAMLERELAAEVVVVPHHGSSSSSTAGLVAAVDARWALVSAGFGNRWGLPRAEVVDRWRESGAEVVTTAEGGALGMRISPAGGVGEVEAWRRRMPRWWRRR